MGLGFWTGMREAQVGRIDARARAEVVATEEKRYQQGRTDRAEEIELSNLTSLRGAVLPMIMARYSKNKEQRDSITSQLSALEGYQLSRGVSLALIKSGQAGTVIETAKKDGGFLRPEFISHLTQSATAEHGEEDDNKLAEIVLNGIKLVGNDLSDANQEASIFEAVFGAKTQEQLLASIGTLNITTPTFTSSALNINFAEGQELAQGTINSIGRETKERMATMFGTGVKFVADSAGGSGSMQYDGTVPFGQNRATNVVSKINDVIVKVQQSVRDISGNQDKVFSKVQELIDLGASYENVMNYLNFGIGVNQRTRSLVFATIPVSPSELPDAAPVTDSGPTQPEYGGFSFNENTLDSLIQ